MKDEFGRIRYHGRWVYSDEIKDIKEQEKDPQCIDARPTYAYFENQCPKCNGLTTTKQDLQSPVFIVSCTSCNTNFSNVGPVVTDDRLVFVILPPPYIKEMIPT